MYIQTSFLSRMNLSPLRNNSWIWRTLVCGACLWATAVMSQSWIAGSPPNDSVATNYFPYLATETANIHYGSHNGSEIGDIYVPNYNGKPIPANSTNRPAVIVVHGGGGTGGSRASTREIQECQLLAAHGYVAFNIDYTIGAVYPNNILEHTRLAAGGALSARECRHLRH